jgi:hypothetical protein
LGRFQVAPAAHGAVDAEAARVRGVQRERALRFLLWIEDEVPAAHLTALQAAARRAAPGPIALDPPEVAACGPAVDAIVAQTGASRVKAIVHCQGSTSFTMSALAGLLPAWFQQEFPRLAGQT